VLVSRDVCCGGATKDRNAQVQASENCSLDGKKMVIGIGAALTDEEATRYRIIIGGLQYLTLRMSDISFAVNRVYQFLHAPTDFHMAAVKRIL
jgi:hypothetical protein